MTQRALERSAIQYAEFWLRRERSFVEALAGHDPDARLQGLRSAAGYFRIARNFPTEFDLRRGLPRLAPVRDLLEDPSLRHLTQRNLNPLVESLRRRLGELYGGRDLLSAATKFLWVLRGDPVIIFDSQARVALGTPYADYGAYVDSWRAMYTEYAPAIRAACRPVVRNRDLAPDPTAQSERAKAGADQEWFRHRVFDIHLWTLGAGKRLAPVRP